YVAYLYTADSSIGATQLGFVHDHSSPANSFQDLKPVTGRTNKLFWHFAQFVVIIDASGGGPSMGSTRSLVAGPVPTNWYYAAVVPGWAVALLASVAPAIWLWRRVRRRPSGICPVCGYDLRASPQRCPECGTAVRQITSSPTVTG